MKFGMPTMFEFNSIEQNIQKAIEAKASFLELNINFPYVEKELLDNNIIYILNRYNIEYTLHFYDEADFSLNKDLIESYITSYKKWAKRCKELNIKSINIHLNVGRIVTILGKKNYINELYNEEYLNNLIENLNILDNISKDNNVVMTIENVKSPDFIKNTYQYLDKYKLTYDVGHDYIYKEKLLEIFKKEKPYEMHLHDSDGTYDHLELYTGKIDINKYINLCSNNTYILIEVKAYSAFIESMKKLIANGLY